MSVTHPKDIEPGQIVRVRSRQYLVEDIIPSEFPDGDTRVRLACLDDDSQGQPLEVFWEREVDAKVLGKPSWQDVASRGFDKPKYFSAYLHTLRWNCVTSTKPNLFQAPYRAGIEVKAYQLEPLRKALQMPRVSLFIADDVGLGKTIEAGLILREMLIRQKIRRVVIACPPSVVRQWQEEMENRFGLLFQIFDRDFVASRRQERGYSVNPWRTHNRFIISHALLRDEAYAAPLRDWLEDFSPGSLLILDEAHNAAPSSGARYAIDSQLTKVTRELAPKFEHKLFLSATPHNGHSNSFSALLEILDPQRFCRGVPASKESLEAVLVRRLKQDLREIGVSDFPKREVIPFRIDGLPIDAPELKLARLLQEYRKLREAGLKDQPKSVQTAFALVMTNLQKRLLSSIEAFSRTLKVHRKSILNKVTKEEERLSQKRLTLLKESPSSDDEQSSLSEEEVQAEEDSQMMKATSSISGGISQQELDLLDQMETLAESSRYRPDPRIEELKKWIKKNQCPELGISGAVWENRRVLIFTEYTDTKRYLEEQLERIIISTDKAQERISTFHGGMGDDRRETIKTAFNTDPAQHPLRILIATDAAREGVNLQNHCADIFHFDVPWNPSRMEQRNGRIDRKLQREKEVRCYYFVLPQRPEDRVLDVLVRKLDTIHKELGSVTPVVEKNLDKLFDVGIRTDDESQLVAAIENVENFKENEATKSEAVREELETVRPQNEKLLQQQQQLDKLLVESATWLQLDHHLFRDALSASLEIMKAKPLEPIDNDEAIKNPEKALWQLPELEGMAATDPTWLATLDTLRRPRQKNQKTWDWRKESPIRPVVFRDPGVIDGSVVHLHLEHRLVQRLLGRFISQGFLHDELTRSCILLTDHPTPYAIALGRLSLFGHQATRLHDELIAVAAEWIDPASREKGRLTPLKEDERDDALALLETSLKSTRLQEVPQSLREQFKAFAQDDVSALLSTLNRRAKSASEKAQKLLVERAKTEAADMKTLLLRQRKHILDHEAKVEEGIQLNFFEKFDTDELRQLEADKRHWRKRLDELEIEIQQEPRRIENSYEIKASRVEPVGLVYLWPVSR